MKPVFLTLIALALSFSTTAQESPLWLRYSAISPDGSQIAFCYQGDIYKIPVDGGVALQLTTNNAYDANPVWSHDSKKIAFSSDRYGNNDVFIVEARGGAPTRLTFHSSGDTPSDFSPDNEHIIFTSTRTDAVSNQMYPYWRLPELYSIPVTGGRPTQVLTISVENAKYSPDGTEIIYQDIKGYEDPFRKHHTSNVTRDIWTYSIADQSYQKLTEFNGEDRNPVFVKKGLVYYLNEESGSFNVYKMTRSNPSSRSQVTDLKNHPVRYLSVSESGVICFSYNGELYTLKDGEEPVKVAVQIFNDTRYYPSIKNVSGGVTDFAVSSNEKEIVFIHRGDVFATSLESNVTKQITATPEQERGVHISPDGKSILYASERDNSWNLYISKVKRDEEKYFFNSTLIKEEIVVATDAEEFQPAFSPDGKEIAYLENRTTLKVINMASKVSRVVLPGTYNYSYADGDQHYSWSPDSKWLLVDFLQDDQWISEVGVVNASGNDKPINLTNSGYSDYNAQWGMDGEMIYYYSDRDGMKNHASWGGQDDIYGLFFNQKAFDKFKLTEEEFDLEEDNDEDEDDEDDDAEEDKKKKKKDKEEEKEDKKVDPIVFDFNNLKDRKTRLTKHSANLSGSVLSKDGEKLYYFSRYEKKNDLWELDLRKGDINRLMKLGNSVRGIELSKDGKNLFVLSDGSISKVELSSKKNSPIKIKAEMTVDEMGERVYFYEHMWRQVREKFYVEDLHGVDWDFYKTEYARFLPHINNNRDFAIMSSELLGELNASHTGCRYSPKYDNPDATASLGLFYELSYEGDGLKIAEVMAKSPVINDKSKIRAGTIIEKINGNKIIAGENFYPYLNRLEGDITLLSLYDPVTKKKWEETVKPFSFRQEMNLRYDRWVENCKKITEDISGGKVGYVHVKGMNNQSFKEVYSNALGENYGKDALIVDTRFNGGGWLHDDLCTFLSGEKYMSVVPRGQKLGIEPMFKWTKPSAVIMSEGNYSDAHLFPQAYKLLEIGELVGMPVAGTGTAVWWERLHNRELVFGIPQVGMVDNKGNYMENNELQPDHKVPLSPEKISKGQDEQIEKAVEILLKTK